MAQPNAERAGMLKEKDRAVRFVGMSRDVASVKARVRREHAVIRTLLDVLDDAAREVHGRVSGLPALRRAVWELYVVFDDHLAMEEALVLPLLKSVDAWGPVRAENMLTEHNEQRQMLLALVDDTECDQKDASALAEEASWLVKALRKDIDAEDEALEVLDRTAGFVPGQSDG